jgi:hypothetical protein
MTTAKYRIAVRMEIEVDPAAWQFEYGMSGDVNDVEDYLLGQMTQSPAAEADCYTVAGFAVEETH